MSEDKLIAGCINGDTRVQSLVYTTYGSKVFGICKRYMKNRERAEEMVMNTFLNVFQKISQFGNNGSFEGWILRIAVNCCLMELRKKNIFNADIAQYETTASNLSQDILMQADDVAAMLNTLPEGARIVFNLYAIEGYKHAEIAEKLGISEGTSKSQLHYAKEKLKQTFFTIKIK